MHEFHYFLVRNASQKYMYNVKGTVEIGLWKSDTNVFSFIDVYPGIFVYWRNIIQISYTDYIYTLLPSKEPRDVTIKRVHSEKHSDVNRRVVAVLKSRRFRYWM